MVRLIDFKSPEINNLIAIATFGSYGTEFWVSNRSDIDVLILLQHRIDARNEFKIEDSITTLLQKHFNYENIHLTFIYTNDFSTPFGKQYIESNNKLIIDSLKEIDFRLYVNKYIRENQWLQSKIDEDNEMLRRADNGPYYKYKKERISLKFNTAKDVLTLMQSAINEYTDTKSVHVRRAILGYFQDFSEYIIDMCETYLVMTDNYTDGCSALELINRARIHGFIDDTLCEFITDFVRLRNRYTHDYYKRNSVEEDILKCCFSEMIYLEIFLEVSESHTHRELNPTSEVGASWIISSNEDKFITLTG